jgi:diaminopimelate decarboxylase
VLARVVGKHCESGDVVVRDEFLPGDVRRATCSRCRHRRVLPQHGQQLQRRAAPARGGRTRWCGEGLVRRETEQDLLSLDVE